jgi:hypothetical protein
MGRAITRDTTPAPAPKPKVETKKRPLWLRMMQGK